MKITKIEKDKNVFSVTQTPNILEKFFFGGEKVEKYKFKGEVFQKFDHIKVFYKETGEALEWNDEVCKALNNYVNSF